MRNASMRFCGFTFHHNPATLKIESVGNIRELNPPYSGAQSDHLGSRLRRISGEGELYGADCIAQFNRLQKLFENGTAGLLSLPHMPVMSAFLKELQMTAQSKENILGYRFVFLEAHPFRKDASRSEYYETIVPNESLWDISYRFDVPLEELVRLNPQIRYIDSLDEGERVRLC